MATIVRSSNRRVSRLQVFRPLLLWVLFVVLLTPVVYHRQHYPFTRVSIDGSIDLGPSDQIEVKVGSTRVDSSTPPPLGYRLVTISAPDCEPTQMHRFLWYGENPIGPIALRRNRESVRMSVEPPALNFSGDGPYQRFSFTNFTATNHVLAVGTYRVVLVYDRFSEKRQFTVTAGSNNSVALKVPTTTVTLNGDRPGVIFKLAGTSGTFEATGTVPTTLRNVPVGDFSLEVRRGDYVQTLSVSLSENGTNTLQIRFPYGEVKLNSQPQGAQIRTRNGSTLGVTPMTIGEIRPGETEFILEAPGYVSQTVKVLVRDEMTESTSVRLKSRRFIQAFEAAQRILDMSSPDLETAYSNVIVAVNEDPGSEEAGGLRKAILLRLLPVRAGVMAAQKNFTGAIEAMAQAIELAPENTEFRTLRARYVQYAREKSKADLAAQFESLLKDAASKANAKQFPAALKAVDDAIALEPGDLRSGELRTQIQKAAAQFEVDENKRREKDIADAKRRFPEEQFTGATARQKDDDLFDNQLWHIKAPLGNVIAAADRAFKKDSIKWTVFEREMVREDTMVAWARYSSLFTAPRIVVLVINEEAPGDVIIRAKFWVYSYGDGMNVGSGVTPVNPKHFFSDEPGKSRQVCNSVIDSFRETLQKELK